MSRIRKNLSDAEMLQGWQEQPTFETEPEDEPVRPPVKALRKDPAEDINSAYLTPELKAAVGKALLELKLNMYKEGVVDYQIKVSCQGNQVSLCPSPPKLKSRRGNSLYTVGETKRIGCWDPILLVEVVFAGRTTTVCACRHWPGASRVLFWQYRFVGKIEQGRSKLGEMFLFFIH